MRAKAALVLTALLAPPPPAIARELDLFTFLDHYRTETRVVLATTSEEDLEGALESGETLTHLETLDMYIVNGVSSDVDERATEFEGVEGVEWAIADKICEPCGFVPDEHDTANLWWMTQGHNAAFATSGSQPYGWDVFRSLSAPTQVAVIDSGVGVYLGHEDFNARAFGVAVYDGVDEESMNYYPALDFLGHGSAVAGQVAATGNNNLGTAGARWWGGSVVPIRFASTGGVGGRISHFLEGVEWALLEGIKLINFSWYVSVPNEEFYEDLNESLDTNAALLFWAPRNTDEPGESIPGADQPYLVWGGATDKDNEPAGYSPAIGFLDCRSAVGGDDETFAADDSTKVIDPIQGGMNGYVQSTGNSLAIPTMAGLTATLFDILPASLNASDRRDLALDILLRTSDKIADDDGNWGRINFRNAYGVPPESVSVVTGTGSPTITDFWREEGTVSTISSDQNIGGTNRLKIEAVFACPYADPTTVGDLHFRFRVGGLSTTATVKLKDDNGNWSASTTIPVTTTPVLSERYFFTNYITGTPNAQNYIDSSGNVTVRIEVPGPEQFQYEATFDQLSARWLRASEDE